MENHLNIKNQFVPYELSVKLKELGFNEKCIMSFNYIPRNGNVRLVYGTVIEEDYIPAPLLQQAEDFLLKKYNLYGIIIPTITMHWTFKTMTVVEGTVEVPPYKHVDSNDYSSVEEARQSCLEKLIAIVEDKN